MDIVHKTAHATDVVTRDAGEGDETTEYLKVPISSTGQDRDGDEFSPDGLRDLRDQILARSRPTFGNHGRKGGGGMFSLRYDWKDILGSLEDADIETEAKDAGETVEILNGYIRPNPHNERAADLKNYVKDGMPVGFSIGFGIGNAEEKDAGGMIFHSTDLMEVSSVGIQSNRESVATDAADTAVAMAKAADDLPADIDEETLAKAMVEELLDAHDADAERDHSPTGDEWVQRQFSTDDTDDDTHMGSDTDTDETNSTDDRIVDLLERQQDTIDAVNGRIDDLEKRLDGDGDDETEETETDSELRDAVETLAERMDALEEERSTEETDDDTDDDPERTLSVVLADTDDEDARKEFEALKDHADDDGRIDLAESKTQLFADAEDTDDDTDDSGALI